MCQRVEENSSYELCLRARVLTNFPKSAIPHGTYVPILLHGASHLWRGLLEQCAVLVNVSGHAEAVQAHLIGYAVGRA